MPGKCRSQAEVEDVFDFEGDVGAGFFFHFDCEGPDPGFVFADSSFVLGDFVRALLDPFKEVGVCHDDEFLGQG